jgi:hypothetical protein
MCIKTKTLIPGRINTYEKTTGGCPSRYSYRNATIGSTRIARRAGM